MRWAFCVFGETLGKQSFQSPLNKGAGAKNSTASVASYPALTFFLQKVRCVLAFFKPERCRNCNPFINIPSNADLDVSI
jgi:hypothetical protein